MTRYAILSLSLPLLLALPAQAEWTRGTLANAYQKECGSCHVAFAPHLLDAKSWVAVMNGLPKHFGTDASLDPGERSQLISYLASNGSKRPTQDASGKPLLRITESRQFRHEHDEISASVWKRPSVKTASNCAACHPLAAESSFNEHDVQIPK